MDDLEVDNVRSFPDGRRYSATAVARVLARSRAIRRESRRIRRDAEARLLKQIVKREDLHALTVAINGSISERRFANRDGDTLTTTLAASGKMGAPHAPSLPCLSRIGATTAGL
jgi:hypothetical protein